MIWFLLLVGVIFLAEYLLGSLFTKTPKRAAQEIVADTKALYSQQHEFAEVAASSFPDVDQSYYERMKGEFESLGFRYLVDMEDRTANRQYPRMRTFLRCFLGDGGAISGAVYHLKLRGHFRFLQLVGILPRQPYFIDLETELSDGTFVATSNTLGGDLSSPVPGISYKRCPQHVSLGVMLESHRSQLASQAAAGSAPRVMRSVPDLWAMQHRLQLLKNAHKAGLGYVDHEQIAGALARAGASGQEEALARELRQLREENLRSAAG
jgi:hypothetical protein